MTLQPLPKSLTLPAKRQNNCSSQSSAADVLSVIRITGLSLEEEKSPGKEVIQKHTHTQNQKHANKQNQRQQQIKIKSKNPQTNNSNKKHKNQPKAGGGNRERKGEKRKISQNELMAFCPLNFHY